MYQNEFSVLPTATKINPSAPQSAVYFDKGQVAFVMQRLDVPRSRPTCVATSFGGATPSEDLGAVWTFRHDQTNAFLGTYRVVGIAVFATGETYGNVPNAAINHRVFK
jgi:hypothetical protein